MGKKKEYKSLKINKEFREKYFEEFFERIGILCLTAKPCSDEMWKKYANENTGFVIGYNSRILFDHLGGGGIVKYGELPTILPSPIMSREEIRYKQIYHKEKRWEFEEEYRTEKFCYDGFSADDRQIKLPIEAFNSIILGEKMDEKNKIEIIKSINENIGDIPIYSAENFCEIKNQ